MFESIFNIEDAELEDLSKLNYCLVIYAWGYEQRATNMLKLYNPKSDRAVAIGFNFANCLAYNSNKSILSKGGVELFAEIEDQNFQDLMQRILAEATENLEQNEPCRILVDISCFNRYRLASIIHLISAAAKLHRFVVDFFYSVAKYSDPPLIKVPNTVVSPVHPAFAGWPTQPANPTAAIVGLGYEQDQALGIVEYLQANPVWLFSPVSSEKRYEPAVENANGLLLEELPEDHVVKYEVEQPANTFRLLDGMIRGLQHDHNVVVVPFGPKIFVLCSLLAAWRHTNSAVWRVSAGTGIDPYDRKASKFQSLLRISAQPAS